MVNLHKTDLAFILLYTETNMYAKIYEAESGTIHSNK